MSEGPNNIRMNQSQRVQTIKIYHSNRTSNCIDALLYILKQDDKTLEERDEKYEAVAMMASALGFSSMINDLNGMKSPMKDPYMVGMVIVMNIIQKVYPTYEAFFDHSAYFIKAFGELVNHTFELNQNMRNNITTVYEAYVDRENYEQRKREGETKGTGEASSE